MEKRIYYSIIEIYDLACAAFFGVTVPIFIEVIDKRCTEAEIEKILWPVLLNNGKGEFVESKQLFNSKLKDNEKQN